MSAKSAPRPGYPPVGGPRRSGDFTEERRYTKFQMQLIFATCLPQLHSSGARKMRRLLAALAAALLLSHYSVAGKEQHLGPLSTFKSKEQARKAFSGVQSQLMKRVSRVCPAAATHDRLLDAPVMQLY